MAAEIELLFASKIESLDNDPRLRARVLCVIEKLPDEVRSDFLSDPTFRIAPETYEPGRGFTLYMSLPKPDGSASRCVILRPKLATCDEAFAFYVIAHELAHAFLRNGGWGDITDREKAADALAESWGFPKTRRPLW